MRTSRALLAAGLLGTLALAGGLALAAPKDKDKDDKVAKGAITPYDQQLIDAHKAFAAAAGGSLDDAIAAYRKAIATEPTRPEAHLYLGAALYANKDYAGAEEALANAANRARANKVWTNYLGKALFLTATVKEVLGKQDEAKSAWGAYADFAKDNPDQPAPAGAGDAPPMTVKVHAASAIERQTKLENYAKLTTEYAKVKELVLKRQKELGIEPTPAKPK